MNTLTKYLEQYALLSLEKQDQLDLLVGNFIYELDLDAGRIRFNDNLDVSVQVLGTESDNTLTWLWAWAEEQTEEVPPALLDASLNARDWGLRQGVREFAVPAVDLDHADGHVFAMISREICNASCYFRDAYEGGAVYFLLFDRMIETQPPFDLPRLSRRFLDLITRYELNHRTALLSYFRRKDIPYTEAGDVISAALRSGEQVNAVFDDAGGLTMLNGEAL